MQIKECGTASRHPEYNHYKDKETNFFYRGPFLKKGTAEA